MNNVLSYKGYFAKVEYSAEDNVLFGKIEGINDLIDFEADNCTQLQKAFEEAVDSYLEFCKSVGKDPDKPYKGSFNVRVDPTLHKKLAEEAIVKETSLNDIVTQACLAYFETEPLFNRICSIEEKVSGLSNFSLTMITNANAKWNTADYYASLNGFYEPLSIKGR